MDAATVEAEAIGAMMIEGNVEVLTIESSLKWMGTLIDEETDMEETREDAERRKIPSASATQLEAPLPQRKRRILKEEVHESWLVRRRRTISVTTVE